MSVCSCTPGLLFFAPRVKAHFAQPRWLPKWRTEIVEEYDSLQLSWHDVVEVYQTGVWIGSAGQLGTIAAETRANQPQKPISRALFPSPDAPPMLAFQWRISPMKCLSRFLILFALAALSNADSIVYVRVH